MLSSHSSQNCFSCRDSWGSLPGDLLLKSTDLLNLNFDEGRKLRSINAHWRKTIPSFREGGFKEERPWLLYRERGSGQARFYDPVRERVHNRRQDQNLEGARFLGSTLGWVVMSDSMDVNLRGDHQTFLYNPFTSERYELPPLTIGNPYVKGMLRYGVLTGDPREDNTYACLLIDNVHILNRLHPRLHSKIYYVARTNGAWAKNWSVTSIPIPLTRMRFIKFISPSSEKISVLLFPDPRPDRYDFTFQTQHWNSEIQENDPIEWNPFHDQSLNQVKDRLQLSPQSPTTLAFIGTKTDRERVHNYNTGVLAGSVSYIDGVWLEVRA